MSYIALYRRLRPKNFEQVIGQNHIVKTLKNQIEMDRISHAYLFCGTRGTGKTSTAKIFAKLLNCKQPINNEPCEKCEMCVSFNENRNFNILEIDAASNNSVEDVRNIREEVKYPPTDGKYKVYIIDEVHMLSIGAFNALLKTLEEPPNYVIFILATTDPHKIPVTILSRCQRFDFKRISSEDMVNTIKKYMLDENVVIEDKALYYIAKISDGAMRDALSIVDQCISFYYGEEITLDKVLEIVGAVDDEVFFRFLDAIMNFDTVALLNIIDEITEDGRDINHFVSDFIVHIRNILVCIIGGSDESISTEKIIRLKEQSQKRDKGYFIKLIEDFSNIQSSLKYAFDEKIVFEVLCIKICSAVLDNDIEDVKEKIKYLEKKIDERPVMEITTKLDDKKPKEEKKLREIAVSSDIQTAIDNYNIFANRFQEPESTFIKNCQFKSLEDSFIYLVGKKVFVSRLEGKKIEIEEVLFELFNKQYNVRIITEDDYNEEYKKIVSTDNKVSVNNDENSNTGIENFKNSFPIEILEID